MAVPALRRASRGAARTGAPAQTLEVTVLDRQRKRRVSGARLRLVIERAAVALGTAGGDIAIVLGRDALLRRLNREYRGKDAPTDVLSFAGARDSGVLGDIVISVDAAERNAAGEGHSLSDELDILVLHGWLHLRGYDHEGDKGAMTRLERRLRRQVLPQRGTRA